MIKFFRHIRQSLIMENKTGKPALQAGNKASKYILYAIGEIVLVVIGILIALNINNNNEINKDRVLEQQYIERLITQFQKDSVELSKLNKAFQFFAPHIKKVDSLVALADNKSLDSNNIVKIPVFLTLQSQYITETTVIDELNNTGNMALITSVELKDALVSYQNALTQQINMFNATSLKNSEFDNFLINHGELKNGFYDLPAKHLNSEFKNRYWFVAANKRSYSNIMSDLEVKSNAVLKVLRNKS